MLEEASASSFLKGVVMDKKYFTEEDYEKVVEFLNAIAMKAEFNNMKTQEIIEYYTLLSRMQRVILPKIKDNIFEIMEVIKPVDAVEGKEE